MFKFNSVDNEVMLEMLNKLNQNQLDNISYHQSKLINTAELLSNAANICDQLGYNNIADEITQILLELSKKDGNND